MLQEKLAIERAPLRNVRLTAVQIGTRFAGLDQLPPLWAT